MAGRIVGRMGAWALMIGVLLIGTANPATATTAFDFTATFKQAGVDTPVLARAWAPDNVSLRGILYLPPFAGGDTRPTVINAQYQALATSLGLGIVGFQDRDSFPGHYEGATATEIRSNVQMVLDGAAAGLSRPQISNAPLAFYGVSKGGWMDAEIASVMPERTLCFVADKSASWIYSISDQAALVPGLFIGGQVDGTAGPDAAAYAFNIWRNPIHGEVSLMEDWQVGHTATNFNVIQAFIGESIAKRYPAGQLPSTTPGNPLALNSISFNTGWLVESSYNAGFIWIRTPETAPLASYSKTADAACWVPSQTMAKVLRAENAEDPNTAAKQVDIQTTTGPQGGLYAYIMGQTLDVAVTNSALNPADVTRVEIFHEDELIGDFPSFNGVAHYTLTTLGVNTFWTEVTYMYGGQPAYANDYFSAVTFVPEPGTMVLAGVGGLLVLLRRKRRVQPQS